MSNLVDHARRELTLLGEDPWIVDGLCKVVAASAGQERTVSDELKAANISRPPVTLYEVRTRDGMAYRAEGDVIEQGDGWFTLWAGDMVMALRVPEADISCVRAVGDEPATEPGVDEASCYPGRCVDNDTFAPTTCAFCGSREKCINHPGQEALARGAAGHPFTPSKQETDASDSEGDAGPCKAELQSDVAMDGQPRRCALTAGHEDSHAEEGSDFRWNDSVAVYPVTTVAQSQQGDHGVTEERVREIIRSEFDRLIKRTVQAGGR